MELQNNERQALTNELNSLGIDTHNMNDDDIHTSIHSLAAKLNAPQENPPIDTSDTSDMTPDEIEGVTRCLDDIENDIPLFFGDQAS